MFEHSRENHEISHRIDWNTVLRQWQEGEEKQWEQLIRERGFSSWWEWRKSYVKELDLEQREWREEIIMKPHDVIPDLVLGGFRGWKQYRPADKDLVTFREMVSPVVSGEVSYAQTSRVDMRTNSRVMSLVGNLTDTSLLVLRSSDFSVVLDGTHRCAATAIEVVDTFLQPSSFVARLRTCQFSESERELLEAFARDREIVIKKENKA
ncbi:hypothetical protein HYV70_03115 [Candidatus Uhrbacteria bacterium]|nr:hypothetical protein [Candidatus Uhrbacteria bacterium]